MAGFRPGSGWVFCPWSFCCYGVSEGRTGTKKAEHLRETFNLTLLLLLPLWGSGAEKEVEHKRRGSGEEIILEVIIY